MKKTYSSLRTVATIFIALGYITLVVGIFFAVEFAMQLSTNSAPSFAILAGIGILLGTLLVSLFQWSIGQFIRLMLDGAENVQSMADNMYLLASKGTN